MAIDAVGPTADYPLNRDLDAVGRDKLEPDGVQAAPAADEPPVRYTTFFTGETPLAVAKHYGIPLVDLYAANRHIVGLKKFGPHVRIKIPYGSMSPGSMTADSARKPALQRVEDPKPPKQITVDRGQTFSEIALSCKKRYGIRPIDLWLANPQIKNVHRLRAGEKLSIPELASRNDHIEAGSTKVLKTTKAADPPIPPALLKAAIAAKNAQEAKPSTDISLSPLPKIVRQALAGPIGNALDLAAFANDGFAGFPRLIQALDTAGTCDASLGLLEQGIKEAYRGMNEAQKAEFIKAFGDIGAGALNMARCGARVFHVLDTLFPEGNTRINNAFPVKWGPRAIVALLASAPHVLTDLYKLLTLPKDTSPVERDIIIRRVFTGAMISIQHLIRGAPALIVLGPALVPVLAGFTALSALDFVGALTTESPQERAALMQEMRDAGILKTDMPDPFADWSGTTVQTVADAAVFMGEKIAALMGSADAVKVLEARDNYDNALDHARAMLWAEEEIADFFAAGRPFEPKKIEGEFEWDAFWSPKLDGDKESVALEHFEALRTKWQEQPELPLDKSLEQAIAIAANLYVEEHKHTWKFSDLEVRHPEHRKWNRYLDQALGSLRYSEDEAPLILGLLRELRQSESAPRARSS